MDNLNMFENLNLLDATIDNAKLDVVKMNFIEAETLTWQALFDGFDTLNAITYSSGIGFIYQLLEKFKEAEIIFGCDAVMSFSIQEIMAYQSKVIEKMRSVASKMKLDLVSRIDDNSLRFYVANTVISHEKIYLLSAEDGRKRVITGSANMSQTAFAGGQRENICYIDGDKAYDWYMDCYNTLKDASTDQIAKNAFILANAVFVK